MSTKYQDVSSRYWYDRSVNEKVSVNEDELNYSSLNTSLMSIMSLDRSIELVSSVEEYFFKRIKCIFLQNTATTTHTLANLTVSDQQQPEYIQVTEAHIELLDEVEFRILQDFIMALEMTPTTPDQFDNQLRAYYNVDH